MAYFFIVTMSLSRTVSVIWSLICQNIKTSRGPEHIPGLSRVIYHAYATVLLAINQNTKLNSNCLASPHTRSQDMVDWWVAIFFTAQCTIVLSTVLPYSNPVCLSVSFWSLVDVLRKQHQATNYPRDLAHCTTYTAHRSNTRGTSPNFG